MGFRRKWGQLHLVQEEEQEERGQEKGSLRSGSMRQSSWALSNTGDKNYLLAVTMHKHS